jgi:hypothetical protein
MYGGCFSRNKQEATVQKKATNNAIVESPRESNHDEDTLQKLHRMF